MGCSQSAPTSLTDFDDKVDSIERQINGVLEGQLQQGQSLRRELDALRREIDQCAGADAVGLRDRERVGEFNAEASRLREQIAALESRCAQLGVAISARSLAASQIVFRSSSLASARRWGT